MSGATFSVVAAVLAALGLLLAFWIIAHLEKERSAALVRLHESETCLRQKMDALPQLAWSACPDGAIDSFNRRGLDYLGPQAEPALQKGGWTAILHPGDRGGNETRWSAALAGKTPFDYECRLRSSSGDYRWHLVHAAPIHGDSGEIVSWFGTAIDIDDSRRAQESIRALNETLEARVRERTAELMSANEELQRAHLRLERATQAKANFVAAVSHEIRTPMNAILGMADILWESDLNPEQRRYLDICRRAGSNLMTLINDILDLSKIETRLELESVDFDPEQVIAEAVEIVSPKAAAKELPIRVRIGPDVPLAVSGDAARVRQILINLLGNAVKFTHSGEITVTARKDAETGELAFTVADTGIGIPPAQIDRIFDEFVQADSSVTREYGGTGLGLTISRRLAERMNGTLTVTSEPGGGSAFRFAARFAEAGSGDPVPPMFLTFNGGSTDPGPQDDRPLRILLAEDAPDNRLLVEAYLKDTPYVLTFAPDGESAIDQFVNGSFDMVLMDVQMPVTDGLTAARTIRSVEAAHGRPPVPILALSANATPSDIARSLDAGCQAHISKPVSKSRLLAAIRDHQTAAPRSVTMSAAAAMDERGVLDAVSALVPQYLRNRREDLAAIRPLLESENFDRLRVIGHNIKGSGSAYGFAELSTVGAALESAARGRDSVTVSTLAAEFEAMLTRLEGERLPLAAAPVG